MREREKHAIQEKLAKCRDLASEFRKEPTAGMIRILEAELREQLLKLDTGEAAAVRSCGEQKFHAWGVNKIAVADLARMEDLDRRKQEALVAMSLCTGTLIGCFAVALALL